MLAFNISGIHRLARSDSSSISTVRYLIQSDTVTRDPLMLPQ